MEKISNTGETDIFESQEIGNKIKLNCQTLVISETITLN